MWKQRNSPKNAIFCKCHGEMVVTTTKNFLYLCPKTKEKLGETGFFRKILGIAQITDVFKIEMWVGNDAPLISNMALQDAEKISKNDGFGKHSDFIDYFVSNYSLETPKPFWVYRWKWLN